MMKIVSIMFLKIFLILLCIQHLTSSLEHENDDESQLDDDWQNDENEDEFMLDDMILSRDQMDELFEPSKRRNGVKNESLLWPNKTVPVLINDAFSTKQKEKILSVLEIISSKTCIRFKQLATNFTELSYVNVSSRNKCSSNVGYRSENEAVDMSLNIKGCLDTGRILHEFMHILGFFHMHTTLRRDDFVTIVWDNIKPESIENFEAFDDEVTLLGTNYDYESVTHYSSTSFSINGSKTIISKTPRTSHLMGQRTHLSEGDIVRVNRLYKC